MNARHLSLPALALAAALSLSACGGSTDDTAAPGAPASQHGSGHGGDEGSSESAAANAADVAFLAGMVSHHEQAVEMSALVLEADPPAEVAAIARQIQQAQAPEIEQMNAMLEDLGAPADAGDHSEHGGSHGGMMSEDDLAALDAATGTEAARLFLEAMVAHHEGAIEASDAEIADGAYAPAVELAQQIKQAQAKEIAEMERLLAAL